MKTITVHGLDLQFDADQFTIGNIENQAEQAIALINGVLQRDPYGLGAQLISHPDEIDVDAQELEG